MTGAVTTYAVHADGTREIIEQANNLVVNSAYVAMAGAAKESTPFFAQWAVGDGGVEDSSAWDRAVAAETLRPSLTDTALARETHRKAIPAENVVYLDSLGAVSETPTNRVQVTLEFLEDEANGTLREWGIFSGGGLLVNRKLHATYEKTEAVRLERVLRFSF